MRHPGRNALLAGALSGVLVLLAAVSSAQPPGSIPPVYTQRLHMPIRGDDFAQPSAVVADLHTGEIFVCDSRRNRVVIFDEKGRFRYEIPGGTNFVSPIDLAVDPEGYLLVLGQVSPDIALLDFDGRLIRKISLAGLPEEAIGTRFTSLALSQNGEILYLLDTENDRLWITDSSGAIQGSIDLTAGRTQEEIDQLRYGHIDVYGETLLVPIPTDGLVHLYDLEGTKKGTIGSPGSAECQTIFPAAAALDNQGRGIILDQQRALFMTWDLDRGVCLSEHYGFGNAPGAFYQPSDLALDTGGRLYVSQGFEGRVQVYDGAAPALFQAAVLEPLPEASAQSEAAGPSDREPTSEAETSASAEALAAMRQAALFEFGALVAAGARESVDRAPRYDPSYAVIEYPGGDVAPDRGAAVDLVVRAFRSAGVDLQEAVHRDILEAPGAYGIDAPNTSIDHRRIRNLVAFFERKAVSLPTSLGGDWAPGDLVFWDRNADGLAGHLGVVTAERGASGRPLIVHHHRPDAEFPGTPGADDVLARWPVVHHFRWPVEAYNLARAVLEETPTPDSALDEPEVSLPQPVEDAAEPPSTRKREVPLEPLPPAPSPGTGGETAAEARPTDVFDFGSAVVEHARLSIASAPRYDFGYFDLAYPGGDLPPDRGAAVDLVVRALRHAGVDLQEAIHLDILAASGAYGIDRPNTSIDHRRIRNLVTFFDRNAIALSTGTEGDWAAGDIVFWNTDSRDGADHLGIVASETAGSGRPLVIHHHRADGEFSGTPSADDVLRRWPVVRHFRWPSAAAASARAAAPAAPAPAPSSVAESQPSVATAQLVAVEDVLRAWARAWSERRFADYLAFYGESFEPSGGLTRSEWEAQRQTRLTRPSSIEVSLADLDLRMIGEDLAEAAFVQSYRSNLYSDKVDKVIVFERVPAGWRIRSERVLRTYRK